MINKREKRRLLRRKNRMVCLIIFLVCLIAYQCLKPSKIEACTPNKFVTVIVYEGDSLWKIAEQFNSDDMDIRNYINLIQQHNEIESSVLQPGDIIEVPVWNNESL